MHYKKIPVGRSPRVKFSKVAEISNCQVDLLYFFGSSSCLSGKAVQKFLAHNMNAFAGRIKETTRKRDLNL